MAVMTIAVTVIAVVTTAVTTIVVMTIVVMTTLAYLCRCRPGRRGGRTGFSRGHGS
jgi:hypothetical protein